MLGLSGFSPGSFERNVAAVGVDDELCELLQRELLRIAAMISEDLKSSEKGPSYDPAEGWPRASWPQLHRTQ